MNMRNFKKFLSYLASVRLMTKLLLSYLLLIILPLILTGIIFYKTVSNTLESKTIYSAQQSFEQAYSYLSYKVHNILNQAMSIATNEDLRTIISEEPLKYVEDPMLLVSDTKSLTTYLQEREDANNILRVRLYVNDELSFSFNRRNIFSLKDIEKAIWYEKLQNLSSRLIWIPSAYLRGDKTYLINTDIKPDDTLSLAMKVLHPSNYNISVGVIRCDFPKQSVISILSNANSVKGSISYLINRDRILVASSIGDQQPEYNVDIENINPLKTTWTYRSIIGKNSMIGYREIADTDWYMVTIIPLEQIIQESRQIFNYLFALIAIMATIAYLTAFVISRSITKRVSMLTEKMNDLRYGKLLPMKPSRVKDEIGMLIDDYNYMTKKMSELIEYQYKMGQEIKNAELKALQAQINPHFLYNTLDMINWYAKRSHAAEILSIVNSLTKFYRLSLSKGQDIVSIADELEHVRSYFTIQNLRFQNKLNLIIDLPKELLNYQIPKITLQPLVENAILHGIMWKESKSGTIKISGSIEDDVILILVQDDGIGMSQEKMMVIFNESASSSKGGFGIRNVDARIKIYYGQEFGLSYESKEGRGTTVEIKLPAINSGSTLNFVSSN